MDINAFVASHNVFGCFIADNYKVTYIGYKDSFTVREGLEHTVRILSELL